MQADQAFNISDDDPTVTQQSFTTPITECHMSLLSVPNLEIDAGPSGQVYAQIKKAIGSVPNP